MSKRFYKLLAIVLAAVMIALPESVFAGESSVESRNIAVLSLDGDNAWVNRGGKKTVSAVSGMKLGEGYTVTTGENTTLYFQIDDDKAVKLDSDSSVEISRASKKKLLLTLKSGEIFFNVTKPVKDNEEVSFRAGGTSMGVRGTAGYLRVQEQKVTAGLFDGNVEWTVSGTKHQIKAGEEAVATVKESLSEFEVVKWSDSWEDCSAFAALAAIENSEYLDSERAGALDYKDLKEKWDTEQKIKADEKKKLDSLIEKLRDNETKLDYYDNTGTEKTNDNEESSGGGGGGSGGGEQPVKKPVSLPKPLNIRTTGIIYVSDNAYRTPDGQNADKPSFGVDLNGVAEPVTFYAAAFPASQAGSITNAEVINKAMGRAASESFVCDFTPSDDSSQNILNVELTLDFNEAYVIGMTAAAKDDSERPAADLQYIMVTTGDNTALTAVVYDPDGNVYGGESWVKDVRMEISDKQWNPNAEPAAPYVIKENGTEVTGIAPDKRYADGTLYIDQMNLPTGIYTIGVTGSDGSSVSYTVKIANGLQVAPASAPQTKAAFSFGENAGKAEIKYSAVLSGAYEVPADIYALAVEGSQVPASAEIIENGVSQSLDYSGGTAQADIIFEGLEPDKQYTVYFALKDEAGNITDESDIVSAGIVTGSAQIPNLTLQKSNGFTLLKIEGMPSDSTGYVFVGADTALGASRDNLESVPDIDELKQYAGEVDSGSSSLWCYTTLNDTIDVASDYTTYVNENDVSFYALFAREAADGTVFYSDQIVSADFSGNAEGIIVDKMLNYPIVDTGNVSPDGEMLYECIITSPDVAVINLNFGVSLPQGASAVLSLGTPNGPDYDWEEKNVSDWDNISLQAENGYKVKIEITAENLSGKSTLVIEVKKS